jgi:hypothetical protein
VSALGGPHDARVLADGSVTVHDNGTGLNRSPVARRFAIDAGARTATLVETVSDPAVVSSFCCGSARKLPGGDWLVNWGSRPLVTQLAATGTRVFELQLAGPFSYRAVPVAPGALARSALRAGMDAQHPR